MKRIIVIILFLISCNPAKRVINNYEQFEEVGKKWVEKNPCVNDSSVIYLPGRIDSILINVPIDIERPNNYSVRDILDSIRSAANNIDEIVKPRMEGAYKKGYSDAISKVKTIKIPVNIHDTIKIVVKDKQYNGLLQSELNSIRKQWIETNTKKDIYKKNSDKWFIMFLIALGLLIIVSYINVSKKWL
jgi:hypothetical protein